MPGLIHVHDCLPQVVGVALAACHGGQRRVVWWADHAGERVAHAPSMHFKNSGTCTVRYSTSDGLYYALFHARTCPCSRAMVCTVSGRRAQWGHVRTASYGFKNGTLRFYTTVRLQRYINRVGTTRCARAMACTRSPAQNARESRQSGRGKLFCKRQ